MIDLSRPEFAHMYDGAEAPKNLAMRAYLMLRDEKFDQVDSELSAFLDRRERLPDGRFAYAVTMYGLKDDFRVYGWEPSLERIRQWRTRSPRSRHASVVEALYWQSYAWYGRGSAFANAVSEKGWQLFRERNAQARRALESGKQFAGTNPLWASVMIDVSWDEDRPRAEIFALFADAVKRDPGFQSTYIAMAWRLTPRWGGDIERYRDFVEDAVKRTRATEGATMYARLYWVFANVEFDRSFSDLGIPWPKMKSGFDDLIARYPSPWNVNNFASFACRANDKATFLKLLPKLTPE